MNGLPRSCGGSTFTGNQTMQTQTPKFQVLDKAFRMQPNVAEATQFCLLRDGIISVDYQGATRMMSLPEAYAALAMDRVDDFPGLRPHQKHFWHATLCQVGTIAMVNAGIEDPPHHPEEWLRILSDSTVEKFPDNAPWSLAVDDITQPAFLQPPASVAGKFHRLQGCHSNSRRNGSASRLKTPRRA